MKRMPIQPLQPVNPADWPGFRKMSIPWEGPAMSDELTPEVLAEMRGGLPGSRHFVDSRHWTADRARNLLNEYERLKEGNFTEAEFQNLCHNMKVDGKPLTYEDVERFQRGCDDYQRKLFGTKCDEKG